MHKASLHFASLVTPFPSSGLVWDIFSLKISLQSFLPRCHRRHPQRHSAQLGLCPLSLRGRGGPGGWLLSAVCLAFLTLRTWVSSRQGFFACCLYFCIFSQIKPVPHSCWLISTEWMILIGKTMSKKLEE